MDKDALKARLEAWKPPPIDTSKKPGGLLARRFSEAVRGVRGGGYRFKGKT